MRLVHLYLRSRLAGWAALCLAAVGALTWFWLQRSKEVGDGMVLMLVTMPLAAAVVIGVSAGSPFDDAEQTASRSLPALRFGHLTILLVWGGASLGLAASSWSVADVQWELIRNLAGYTGLAFLGARLLGSSISWVVPLGYAALALAVGGTARWAWPKHFPNDRWSVTIAVVLIAVGLVVISRQGAHEPLGETS